MKQSEVKAAIRPPGILRSGIIFAAVSFLSGIGNYTFQALIGRQMGHESAEYGLVNTTLSFTGLLGLPLTIATIAITHYIARFSHRGDNARLQSLLAGCRKFLLHLTVAGSVLAILIVKPLSDFFQFPRASLMLTALSCVIAGFWGAYATALCQGLAWFKRLAFIGLLAVLVRILFGWTTTRIWPVAELAVVSSAVMLLANLVLLFWRREVPRWEGDAISPWNREFSKFVFVSAACVFGTYCFTQGDLLVAQRNCAGTNLSAYSAAGLLARALPMVVTPLLTVVFTHRSGKSHESPLEEHLSLLGLYAAGLIFGAFGLFVLRNLWAKLIFGQPAPETAAMIGKFSVTMVFVGLLQGLGMWCLASRWLRLALSYGVLGFLYWIFLFAFGKTPADLLRIMPVAAGTAFALLFFGWLATARLPRQQVER